jgi:hypothetical protein
VSTAKFTTMSYPISTLLGQIELGQIGLPELQRPFVWDRSQVRDLLDSLYRGYPAGYFLMWQASKDVGTVPIGADGKQMNPSTLVVDGQQRLTSLYAVFKGKPVYTENFDEVFISIAFNPVKQRFEVSNSATKNDPEWIDNVSPILSGQTDSFNFIHQYLEILGADRELSADMRKRIAESIQRLVSLNSYQFTAIQLSYDVPVDEVSEIFVRVNSKGTQLDQADFILTLMSVYWDKGRKELEEFCRQAKVPSKDSTAFNWFIEPKPDQLLRVAVGLGHRRARLKYAYELLRGKDLETNEVSDDIREANFAKLKEAQAEVLNLTHFTEYLKAIQEAGFRSGKMITSRNTVIYSYLVFLIGRSDYSIDYPTLRSAIARWFMMCVLTSRYTGSPESQVEKDIRRFAEASNGEQFLATIDQVIDANLTQDFWDVSLPDLLAWSGGYIPSMFAYFASLNLLGAKVLFSNLSVHELLDPATMGKRSAIERHHLFPKAYLEAQGIRGTARTNKVANYALVEWPDNAKISDQAPANYFPQLFAERVAPADRDQMMFWHALPKGWEAMPYDEFLESRQKLMAQVIKAGFERLTANHHKPTVPAVSEKQLSFADLVAQGESFTVEFKSSMVHSYRPGIPEKVITGSVVKTIAAFLNSEGGTLVIGADDDGNPLGIGPDLESKRFTLDSYENFIVTTLSTSIDPVAVTRCRIRFETVQDSTLCLIDVEPSTRPVYATTDKGKDVFFIRAGNSTRALETKDVVAYIGDRFGVS